MLFRSGYSYEGLEYWNKTTQELQRDAIAVINNAYGSPQSFAKKKRTADVVDVPALGFLSGKRLGDETRDFKDDTTFTQYFAVVEVDRQDVETPCEINVYIAGRLAGSIPVMEQPKTGIAKGRFIVDDAVKAAFVQVGDTKTKGDVEGIDHLIEVDITRVSC